MVEIEASMHVRVFLASPGDVRHERDLTREVSDQLRGELGFRNRISIEIVAWDQPGAGVAMEAALTPQAAIEQGLRKPSDCDIVVAILWSRFGTPLPVDQYVKADGTPYLSGTEWEILDGLESARQRGQPSVWIYRCTKVPNPAFDDPDFEEKRAQWGQIKNFFEAFTGEDGALIGGINSYATPSDFRKQFEQHLRDRLTLILGEIPQPRCTVGDTNTSVELSRYTKRISALHSSLELAGFKTRLRVPIDLEELYVPLQAMVDLRATGAAEFADAADAEARLRESEASRVVPLVEAFREAFQRKRRGVVILGDPGSGKTTHLKRLLLWCLKEGPGTLGLGSDLLPVFLPLRELEDVSQGLDAFIEQQLDNPHLQMSEGFGARLLERGRLLLLFDGLDEVVDHAQRAVVSRWIESAVKPQSTCVPVVTCRFAGYGGDARLGPQFLELHLRPLSREQSEAFICNWYHIVETGLAAESAQGEIRAAQRSGELVERLREPEYRSARLLEMTRNPLLLANLCLVHRDRGTLPQGRGRLYSECIDVLLELWRESKGIKVKITSELGRRVLQPAALWLHGEDERTRASAAELAPVIEPALERVQWQGGPATDFLANVRDQSGLLTGWGQTQYGLMHLGFQEYLAASELRRRALEGEAEVLETLAERYGQSWWGDESESKRANYYASGIDQTSPVDAYAPNPWGLHDTAGNVWEWVQDCWHATYEGAPSNGSACLDADSNNCGRRVVRGGAWDNLPRDLRSALRFRYSADNRDSSIGFRLAQDL